MNYAAMQDEINSLRLQLAAVQAERDRLREACQAIADVQTKHGEICPKGFLAARDLCDAALSATEGSQK